MPDENRTWTKSVISEKNSEHWTPKKMAIKTVSNFKPKGIKSETKTRSVKILLLVFFN